MPPAEVDRPMDSGGGPVGKAGEGPDEIIGPWPSLGDAQCGAPGRTHQHAGRVQEGVAQALGLGPGQLTVEAQPLHPGE